MSAPTLPFLLVAFRESVLHTAGNAINIHHAIEYADDR